jgi:predicted transcriptional regulator
LDSFSILQKRKNLNSPITVSAGDMNLLTEIAKSTKIVTKKELANKLLVTEDHIGKVAKKLIKVKLIEKPKPAKYHLSKKLRKYFRSYKNQF